MKIRTITYGLRLDLSRQAETVRQLAQATEVLQKAKQSCEAAGYSVQTVRVSLAPFLADLKEATQREKTLAALDAFCESASLDFLSLGPLYPGQLAVEQVVAILARYPAFNFSTVIAERGQVLAAGVLEAARIIKGLAGATDDGLCNFRYCAIASCPPGIPFFPAAYHSSAPQDGPSLAVGLQMPDLAYQTVAELAPRLALEGPQLLSEALSQAIVTKLSPLQDLLSDFCSRPGRPLYAGLDLSLAPLGEDSVVAVIEAAGLGKMGEAGTLAVVAALTEGLRQAGHWTTDKERGPKTYLRTIGYNGLMLPILEDGLLGQRAAEGLIDVQKLLMYSAVCGIGLDVVPLPGETSVQELARLLFDVAALSARYNKPLSARLFPVPGKKVGETTEFNSPYLTNTTVLKI